MIYQSLKYLEIFPTNSEEVYVCLYQQLSLPGFCLSETTKEATLTKRFVKFCK